MGKYFQIIVFLGLVFLLFLKPDFKSEIDPAQLAFFSVYFLTFIFMHLYRESRFTKNWMRIDIFFLLGFFIVHFQWVVMFALSDIIPENISRVWVNPIFVNYGVWLSVVGGVAWILGYSIKSISKAKAEYYYVYRYNNLLNFTIILFVLFLATVGGDFLSGGVYKGSGGESSGEGISAYIQLLFSVCIIILTVFVIMENKKFYRGNIFRWVWGFEKKYLLLVSFYIILFLSVGDRGGPISLLITILVLIGGLIRSFKLRELVLIVLVGAVMMTAIGLGRGITSDQSVLSSGLKELEFDSGYSPTLQLAGSIRTLFHALANVPERSDFFYGRLWLGGIMSPFPFLQSTYLDLTNSESYELSSSGYITYLVYGRNPPSGEGTSLIADIYLNFGLPGILVMMFIFGMVIKKVNYLAFLENNYRWVIIAAIIASVCFFFGRASLFIVLRPILWSFVISFLFVKVYKFRA